MVNVRWVHHRNPRQHCFSPPRRCRLKITLGHRSWFQKFRITWWSIVHPNKRNPLQHEVNHTHIIIMIFLQQFTPQEKLLALQDLLQTGRKILVHFHFLTLQFFQQDLSLQDVLLPLDLDQVHRISQVELQREKSGFLEMFSWIHRMIHLFAQTHKLLWSVKIAHFYLARQCLLFVFIIVCIQHFIQLLAVITPYMRSNDLSAWRNSFVALLEGNSMIFWNQWFVLFRLFVQRSCSQIMQFRFRNKRPSFWFCMHHQTCSRPLRQQSWVSCLWCSVKLPLPHLIGHPPGVMVVVPLTYCI